MNSTVTVNAMYNRAAKIRERILTVGHNKGGHVAASLSCVDILVALYDSGIYEFGPSVLDSRDIICISKGHAELGIYSHLESYGFIDPEFLSEHYKGGKYLLGGHIDSSVPGVHFSSGSLGNGLGIVAGFLIGSRYLEPARQRHGIVLMGDGELCEGSIWESANFIGKMQLGNIIALIDNNRLSATTHTSNILTQNYMEAFESFGWNTLRVDGHKIEDLLLQLRSCKESTMPTLMVCDTKKGYPIKEMENEPLWHTKQVANQDLQRFLREVPNVFS